MAREEGFIPDWVMIGWYFIAQSFQLCVRVRDEIRLVDVDMMGREVHEVDFTTNSPAMTAGLF